MQISLVPLSNQLHSLFPPLFLMINKKNKFSLLEKNKFSR